ncbi:Uncharacterized protein TPAR_03253 [Tolypocladium paradoxum]|uniref:ZN622/Rei1/Reh1 zinc finger C2H2-type domain-containing protein n=1 Tax=Tolypocladium paradoxum TaxID=94208 RepID=A0A2S4L2F2_9HYPO|nr:Uncharacterized protein TPAR_03253 [Tolypocladium paradoxum]
MTGNSGARHEDKLSPSSSSEAFVSLEKKEDDLDLNYGDCHKASDTTHIEDGLSLLSVDEGSLDARKPDVQFEPAQCLFCKCRSTDLDENLEHMFERHGLLIPDGDRLIVDSETLIEYFHLVIFGYFECLYCGSQRSNVQAAQQHMTGKGHCKIDISNEDSEFRDFYDFNSASEDSDGEREDAKPGRSNATFVDMDKSMRLPSGKVLSHRTQGRPRLPRHGIPRTEAAGASSIRQPRTSFGISQPEPESTPDHGEPSQSKSKRVARREATILNQIASLRDSDRRSLMHLPVAQQRAMVLRGKKHVEQARRDENEMVLKIQLKANRSLKK